MSLGEFCRAGSIKQSKLVSTIDITFHQYNIKQFFGSCMGISAKMF